MRGRASGRAEAAEAEQALGVEGELEEGDSDVEEEEEAAGWDARTPS